MCTNVFLKDLLHSNNIMQQFFLLQIFILQVVINKTFSIKFLQENENNKFSGMYDCAVRIYSFHNEIHNLVAFFNESEGITYFLKSINVNTTAKSNTVLTNLNINENITNNSRKYGMYTIIINTLKEFQLFIKRFSSTSFWNPRSKFLLIYLGAENIRELFQIAWTKYIINIIVLVQTSGGDVNILTYFPYKNENCGRIIIEELLGTCATTIISHIYSNKVPSISNGCECKVLLNIFVPSSINTDLYSENSLKSGFEVLLIGNTFKRTNLSTIVTRYPGKSFNEKYSNGSYGGPIQHLFNREYEVLFGHFWMLQDYYSDFDVVYPYLFDKIKWYVPAALPGEQWKGIILVFDQYLWYIVILSFIGNVFIWWIFGKNIYYAEHQIFRNISSCALYSWYTLLLGPYKLPKTSTMRCLVIFWVVCSFLLGTVYQSQLLSILTTPIYEHQISNLKELAESSITIKFEAYFLKVYNNSESKIERRIAKKVKLQTIAEYLDSQSQSRRMNAFIDYPHVLRYNAANYTNPDGSPMVFELPETVFTSQITMYTVKGYPFLDRFNSLIMRIYQNGLIGKWIKDVNRFTKSSNNNKNIQLSINHFIGAYYILIVGVFIAFVTFLCELIIFKRRQIHHTSRVTLTIRSN